VPHVLISDARGAACRHQMTVVALLVVLSRIRVQQFREASLLQSAIFRGSQLREPRLGRYRRGVSRGSSMVLLRTGKVLISWDAMWQVEALCIRPVSPSDTVCEVQPFPWEQRIVT
jgi:hypothetical protein